MAGIELDLSLGSAQIKPSMARLLLATEYHNINIDYVSIVNVPPMSVFRLVLFPKFLMNLPFLGHGNNEVWAALKSDGNGAGPVYQSISTNVAASAFRGGSEQSDFAVTYTNLVTEIFAILGTRLGQERVEETVEDTRRPEGFDAKLKAWPSVIEPRESVDRLSVTKACWAFNFGDVSPQKLTLPQAANAIRFEGGSQADLAWNRGKYEPAYVALAKQGERIANIHKNWPADLRELQVGSITEGNGCPDADRTTIAIVVRPNRLVSSRSGRSGG